MDSLKFGKGKIEFVKENKNRIGIGLGKEIKLISIHGIKPSSKNTKNDNYPLSRDLHFLQPNNLQVMLKKNDWVVNPVGKKILRRKVLYHFGKQTIKLIFIF